MLRLVTAHYDLKRSLQGVEVYFCLWKIFLSSSLAFFRFYMNGVWVWFLEWGVCESWVVVESLIGVFNYSITFEKFDFGLNQRWLKSFNPDIKINYINRCQTNRRNFWTHPKLIYYEKRKFSLLQYFFEGKCQQLLQFCLLSRQWKPATKFISTFSIDSGTASRE